ALVVPTPTVVKQGDVRIAEKAGGRRGFNDKRPPNFTGELRRRGDAWPELSEEDAKRLDDAYRSGEF
ncbi:MAG TPA: hypothetical protein VGC70_12525, partial [Burkholderiales bacterium]